MSGQRTVETMDKRASLGHPSQIWTRGLERRLDMVRREVVGKALRVALYPVERTPLRIFGLSHFVVLEKV